MFNGTVQKIEKEKGAREQLWQQWDQRMESTTVRGNLERDMSIVMKLRAEEEEELANIRQKGAECAERIRKLEELEKVIGANMRLQELLEGRGHE